ncbi:thiamine transporter 1 isoform X1 [Drosophila grimshawi]|uniref:GH18741 n=1 Tax=Drosophila grimshawi TaxID=7222 RepID=B4JGE1_DROGR|nr:thiamine transporter 1 isoform X1 [Drosophila grimshawi]XP_032593424.1 thiamine transporter 1 isoform X1 [Drosophila grimshawi]XP_032593425.1 thiamine transporter 1 isoform X1 [Drosophila grimshawi]EDV92610.1 GH18741 [Drosophila grimshawi]
MKEWFKISCLLCVFGFVREIRPSEPYVTEFILGPWRNITEQQLVQDVYPVGTYSNLVQLVFVFLITDFLRYKPLIITIGAAGVIIWSMLIWTTSLLSLQILEFFYGTYMAAEVAYYTYIYAKVDKKYYPRVTSHTRAAMFGGKLISGITSQLMINLELMDYKQLNYITLTTQIIAMLWAFGLPKVDKSLYFHREANAIESTPEARRTSQLQVETQVESVDSDMASQQTIRPAMRLLWQHFSNAYTNPRVVQWSLWYALGFAGYLQVSYYMQVLWKTIEPNPQIAWNGAVDAVLTALAAMTALAAGYLHNDRVRPRVSLLVLSLLSALEGGSILICCWTHDIYWSYVGFVIFGALYGFTITVASAEVARNLQEESFGLVFGINTLLALVFQSLLTVIVVSETGFELAPVGQYTVYAFYFIAVAIIYLISVLTEHLWNRRYEKDQLKTINLE